MTSAPPISEKAALFQQLQQDILRLQGNAPLPEGKSLGSGLAPFERAFPSGTFPVGVIHEFLSTAAAPAAATNGFIAALQQALRAVPDGPCIWVSTKRRVFPPALTTFGLRPERMLFVDVASAREALWAIEEALQCPAVAAVVGEIGDVSFTESRRLQLAVEESRVTGFIHRYAPRTSITAAVARWQISPMPSVPEDGLPGLGAPRWNVRLLKARNGRPGTWALQWGGDGFLPLPVPVTAKTATAGWAATG